MKKYLPLLFIAGVLIAIICMSQYADSAHRRYDESAQQTKADSVPRGEDNKKHTDTDQPYRAPAWAKYVGWPEGVGAWAVILTLFVIGWQSIETRDSARATRESVEVAKNAERAWVTVSPGILSPKLYPAWEQGTPYPADPDTLKIVHHQLPLLIKNVGQTPAQMDEFACRYIRVDSMEDLPIKPDYGALQPQGEHWIIPNDTHNATVDLETNGGILYERHVTDIRLRKSFLIAFGIVKYRDVHGGRHRTQFCFV